MTEISKKQARGMAADAISALAQENELGDLVIIDDAVMETESAWYFPYDSAAFVEEGEISAALAGNLPAMVSKDGAVVDFRLPHDGH
jgi:hypothetical protein